MTLETPHHEGDFEIISNEYFECLQNPPEKLKNYPLVHRLIVSLIRGYITKLVPTIAEDITMGIIKKDECLPDQQDKRQRLLVLSDWASGHSETLARLSKEHKVILQSFLHTRIVRVGTAGGVLNNEHTLPVYRFEDLNEHFYYLKSRKFFEYLLKMIHVPEMTQHAIHLLNGYFFHYLRFFTSETISFFISKTPHFHLLKNLVVHYYDLQSYIDPQIKTLYEALYENEDFESIIQLSDKSKLPYPDYLSNTQSLRVLKWHSSRKRSL